jgi:hypothetical protein
VTNFKVGDTVSVNGPIGWGTGIATIIRFERAVGIDRAVCLRDRSGSDEGFGTHSIPLHHLHSVSEAEYREWSRAEYVRRFQPPAHGPDRPPVTALLDRETERAIRVLAISDALTASWRARGIIAGTLGQLGLFEGDTAA